MRCLSIEKWAVVSRVAGGDYELLSAIAEGRPAKPSFADGVACGRVLEAVSYSLEQRRWVRVDAIA